MIQRSNTATRIRAQAGSQIFDCKATDLKTSARRYEIFRSRIGWQEVEIEGQTVEQYETWNMEILHRSYNGNLDINSVFLNPVLMRVSSRISCYLVITSVNSSLEIYSMLLRSFVL